MPLAKPPESLDAKTVRVTDTELFVVVDIGAPANGHLPVHANAGVRGHQKNARVDDKTRFERVAFGGVRHSKRTPGEQAEPDRAHGAQSAPQVTAPAARHLPPWLRCK